VIEVVNRVRLTIPPDTDNPFLLGPFAPNGTEYDATSESMKVIGEIPRDLNGIYVRNTHNPVHAPLGVYHPYDGDGMLHAVRFQDGRATYRNRFVRTTGFLAEQTAGKSLWSGVLQPHLSERRGWGAIGAMKDNAGTDVICHAGKLIASMSQGSEPWRIDPVSLDTLGPDVNWAHRIADGLSSHYKVDPETGELMFFNYPERYPYMHYGVVDRENKLVHLVPIELPGARWPHDLGITRQYTVLHDLPYFFDPKALARGERKLEFHRDIPARFGIVPRRGDSSQVKWFEAESCYILHITNCYEVGDEVVMDGCRQGNWQKSAVGYSGGTDWYERIRTHLDRHQTQSRMHRWHFNLKTGKTTEECVDDEITEFPVCSNDFVGRPYRYSYNGIFMKGNWLMDGLKRYDMKTGKAQVYRYGEGRFGSEVQIALRPGAKTEDDGYVVTILADMREDRSEVAVFDAADIEAGPVTRIVLPERVTVGTHACWVEADRISGENRRLPPCATLS
jgi:carotenoid cleavage dioxygenase